MIKEFPDKILLIKDGVIEDYWVLKNLTQCEDAEYIRKDRMDEMLKVAEDHAYLAGQEAMREKLSKLKELANNMYNEAQRLPTSDSFRFYKALGDYRRYVTNELKEEQQ